MNRPNQHGIDWTTSGPSLHLDLPPRGARRAAIEAALRTAIRERRLAPGERLPSTRALAIDLGVARGTVGEAFAQLEAEGYLEARRGAGTFVRDVLAPKPLARRPATAVEQLRFDFDPGVPDLTLFPRAAWTRALRHGLRTAPASGFGYGDPRGRADLRDQLAAYLARARGVIADPELVVVCAGFRHGLSLAARALYAGGTRRIALEDPSVPLHREVAAAAGLRPLPLAVDEHGARTDLLGETTAQALVVAPAHQFPTGTLLHPSRRAAAARWARQGGHLIVEDDYDAELRYDHKPVGALQPLAPEHVAFGGTTSKTLAPGLRLGWLVAPPQLVDRISGLRETEDVHVPVTVQIAFCELLRSGAYEQHVRRVRARYRRRRDRLLELLDAFAPMLAARGIEAGLSLLVEIAPGGPTAAELVERAARHSVGLVSLRPHYADDGEAADGIVIGYGAIAEHELEVALVALRQVLAESFGGARAPGAGSRQPPSAISS